MTWRALAWLVPWAASPSEGLALGPRPPRPPLPPRGLASACVFQQGTEGLGWEPFGHVGATCATSRGPELVAMRLGVQRGP